MARAVTPGSPGPEMVDAAAVERWLRAFGAAVSGRRGQLTHLDAVLGDADHGAHLDRGMTAVVAQLDRSAPANPAVTGSVVTRPGREPLPAGAPLAVAGTTLVGTVGGVGGSLYGTLFLGMAAACGQAPDLDPGAFAAAWRAGLDALVAHGGAQVGDKTMYDALAPACDALEQALADGAGLRQALELASAAADTGRDATIAMVARHGRAARLGQRSAGHQDPGATSAALLVAAAALTLPTGPDPAAPQPG